MQLDLHLLMDLVHDIHTKYYVLRKPLVVFSFVAVNVTPPCIYGMSNRTIWSQLVPRHSQKVVSNMEELLCGIGDVDPLVQDISCFFFVQV